MATAEDLTILALARCAEYSDSYPTARSVLYARLGERQQQLFAQAARTNREYFGVTAIGTLDASHAISLASLGDPAAANPTPAMELISRITVAATDGDPNAPAVGTEIRDVVGTDPHALPPRVTIRGGVIAPVGTDLDHVTQIAVDYSPRPFLVRPVDGNEAIELPEPFHALLVLDLARFNLRKMASISQEVRTVALAALQAEEQEAIANFNATIGTFTAAVERGRFTRTQGDTKQ